MRAAGCSSGSAARHLDILKLAGFVAEERHGATRRFFPGGAAPERRREAILLRERPLAQLVELVRRNPGLAQTEVMDLAVRELGWSRSAAQHRLGRLVAGGLVETWRDGRSLLHAVRADPEHVGAVSARPAAGLADRGARGLDWARS